MTQEETYNRLVKLHECKEPFVVTFSGKKRKSRNGTYQLFKKLITINERNFNEDEAGDNLLFYTAMHELAHHVQMTEYGQTGSRSHTKLFHAILDDLADKAEELGIYRSRVLDDVELENLIREAQTITREIAKLQRELGTVLGKLQNACIRKDVRYEDVVKRGIKISLETEKKSRMVAAVDFPENVSADVQEIIAGERDEEKRNAMSAAAKAGKSAAQVKNAGTPRPSGKGGGETESLLLEKERLEKAIENLQRRLREVMARLNTGGLRAPCAAERRNHERTFICRW